MQAISQAASHPITHRRFAWRKPALHAARWTVRILTLLSLVAFLFFTLLFIRSHIATDDWRYSVDGSGEITFLYGDGRITLGISGTYNTRWLHLNRLRYIPDVVHFDPDSLGPNADNVLGAVWRITAFSPPAGAISIPMGYPLAMFAALPIAWITQRLVREKRPVPKFRPLFRLALAAGPWACVMGIYILSMAAFYDRPNCLATYATDFTSRSITRTRFQTIIITSSCPQTYGGLTVEPEPRLPGDWRTSTVFSRAGFESHIAPDPNGSILYTGYAIPWWPLFPLLAIWPALALHRAWRNRPRAYHSFPLT